jgi:Domain of unknown function (DUF4187)/G-patch domain
LRAEEKAAREAALSKSLDASNKGFKMMKMMGFKEGSALGRGTTGDGMTEPLNIIVKEDRGGIGLDSEKKRKFREQVEEEAKRVKAEEGDYRERVRKEREERRLEGLVHGAQKVAEKLDTEADGEDEDNPQDNTRQPIPKLPRKVRPTSQINILWRGLVLHREQRDRERRMRYDLHQSLSRLPTYNDPDEDKDDKRALGTDNPLEEDVEQEDPELDEFNALEPAERLRRVVGYLREKYHYCFWCKYRYLDASMEGCPGVTEEDHD